MNLDLSFSFAGEFLTFIKFSKHIYIYKDHQGSMLDVQDEFEELWGEEVAETENDVMSLAVSFLLVQACSGSCAVL